MATLLHWLILLFPLILVLALAGFGELYEWHKRWRWERYKASLPVTKDACPHCDWVGFANWSIQRCGDCGRDVYVESGFVKRCPNCKEPLQGLGPAVCSKCGGEWWIGTCVQSNLGSKVLLEYYEKQREAYAQTGTLG